MTAESSNHRVTGVGLGNIVAALVEPGLEVRVRPGSVEPVAWVVCGLLGLVRGGLVVVTDSCEKRVTLAGLGDGNAMLVGEGLELGVGPAVDLLVTMEHMGMYGCIRTCRRSSP